MARMLMILLCLLMLAACVGQATPVYVPEKITALQQRYAGYDFLWPEAMPKTLGKTVLIDEVTPTPAGALNPCREALNFRLGYILGSMKTRVDAAGNTVPDIGAIPNAGSIVNGQSAIDENFLDWAVWGYLSADSKFKGDPRLPTTIAVWLDRFKARLQTAPADEKARAAWKPDAFNPGWSVYYYSTPLLEILARPAFVEAIGAERVEYLRTLFLNYAATRMEKDTWNKTMALARDIVNMPVHEFVVYYHAWLLTSEPRYYLAAYSLIRRMHDVQQPNGTIPYLTKVSWPAGTRVGIAMYYLSVYNDALYEFWQRGDDDMAKATLAKNATASLLRLEPPARYEYHTIGSWWKNTWRTFTWPGELGMAALAANNGELLAVGRREFGTGPGLDNWKLTLGADAFRKAAQANIQDQPRQDRYIVGDPDIGGLRGRFGGWAFNFNTTSYSYTLGGVMTGSDKGFSWLHGAMPYIILDPLARQDGEGSGNLTITEKLPPTPTLLIDNAGDDSWALALAAYHPYAAGPTWQVFDQIPMPNAWRCEQLWFYLPGEAIAVLRSTTREATKALAHEHRFRLAGGEYPKNPAGPDYAVGGLTMTVLATSFPQRVVEQGKLCDLDKAKAFGTWQLALTDVDRSTIQRALGMTKPSLMPDEVTPELDELKLPSLRDYPVGATQYSVVSYHPTGMKSATEVVSNVDGAALILTVKTKTRTFIIHANPTDTPVPAPAAVPGKHIVWQGQRATVALTRPVRRDPRGPLLPGEVRVYVAPR